MANPKTVTKDPETPEGKTAEKIVEKSPLEKRLDKIEARSKAGEEALQALVALIGATFGEPLKTKAANIVLKALNRYAV